MKPPFRRSAYQQRQVDTPIWVQTTKQPFRKHLNAPGGECLSRLFNTEIGSFILCIMKPISVRKLLGMIKELSVAISKTPGVHEISLHLETSCKR